MEQKQTDKPTHSEIFDLKRPLISNQAELTQIGIQTTKAQVLMNARAAFYYMSEGYKIDKKRPLDSDRVSILDSGALNGAAKYWKRAEETAELLALQEPTSGNFSLFDMALQFSELEKLCSEDSRKSEGRRGNTPYSEIAKLLNRVESALKELENYTLTLVRRDQDPEQSPKVGGAPNIALTDAHGNMEHLNG